MPERIHQYCWESWKGKLESFWLGGNETDALDLAHVVEADDPDKGVGVLLLALL